MTIDLVLELITTVGFPIALVIAMGWFIYHIYKRSEIREDRLNEQIAEYQEVNAKAIETLAVYSERLTVIEDDVKEIKNTINEVAK